MKDLFHYSIQTSGVDAINAVSCIRIIQFCVCPGRNLGHTAEPEVIASQDRTSTMDPFSVSGVIVSYAYIMLQNLFLLLMKCTHAHTNKMWKL